MVVCLLIFLPKHMFPVIQKQPKLTHPVPSRIKLPEQHEPHRSHSLLSPNSGLHTEPSSLLLRLRTTATEVVSAQTRDSHLTDCRLSKTTVRTCLPNIPKDSFQIAGPVLTITHQSPVIETTTKSPITLSSTMHISLTFDKLLNSWLQLQRKNPSCL